MALGLSEIAHRPVERQIKTQDRLDCGGALGDAAAVEHHRTGGLANLVERQILGDRQLLDDAVVDDLVDRMNAGRARLERRAEVDLAAVDFDRAGIGGMDAAQDLGQRGFPGAVGAHQGQNLARPDVEIDVGDRHRAAESFGQAANANYIPASGVHAATRIFRKPACKLLPSSTAGTVAAAKSFVNRHDVLTND